MTNHRESLLRKIRALLAKTTENGCTEAEMLSAMSMAQAMMDAHEVSQDEINETKKENAIKETMKDMRDPHHIRAYMTVKISEFTNTKCWRNEYKSQKWRYNFVGLSSDVEFAIWLTEHLTMFVQKELKNYIWINSYTSLEASSKRRVINGFVLGCTAKINTRLGELIAQGKVKANQNANALIVVKSELIERKMQELGLSLLQPHQRSSSFEPDGYKAGQAAGDKANFGRPVGSGSVLRIGSK